MITMREQVKQFIHSRPVTLRREIMGHLHIPSRELTQCLHQLLHRGEVVLYRGRGYFKDDDAYDAWHAENRCRFGAKAGAALRARSGKGSKGENIICQECRKSPVMQRILMVWGRASV